MQFTIGFVVDFEDAGFDTSGWRKSIDGTKTIVHSTFAELLIVDEAAQAIFQVYNAPSDELTMLLNSPEWTLSEI